MERILVTKYVTDLADKYLQDLKASRNGNFKSPMQKLENLHSFLDGKGKNYKMFADYVNEIIRCYDDIITLLPKDFKNFAENHFYMVKEERLKLKFKYQKSKKSFYEHVVDALRYKWVREDVYLEYGLKLGLKACAYCNAQYSTTVKYNDEKFATYDLDHYFPKSKYPFLATSFFNLIPVCAHCNRTKNDSEPVFCLYTDHYNELRPFRFSLEPKAVIDYMLTHDPEQLKINLRAEYDVEKDKLNEFLDDLGITGVYNAHKDEAANILWKAKIYNKFFRSQLKESIGCVIKMNDEEIDRIVFGYDLKHGRVHQKPLTLLGQDIYKEYGGR